MASRVFNNPCFLWWTKDEWVRTSPARFLLHPTSFQTSTKVHTRKKKTTLRNLQRKKLHKGTSLLVEQFQKHLPGHLLGERWQWERLLAPNSNYWLIHFPSPVGFRCQLLAQNWAAGKTQRAPRADGFEENYLWAGKTRHRESGPGTHTSCYAKKKKKGIFVDSSTIEGALFWIYTKMRACSGEVHGAADNY